MFVPIPFLRIRPPEPRTPLPQCRGDIPSLLELLRKALSRTGEDIPVSASDATTIAQAILELAAKAPNPTAGNLAALDAQGNPVDSGKKPSDFQAKLTFDTTPTAGSQNPVTSEGIKSAIDAAIPADYDSVKARLATVEGKIPSQASAQNQLADKAFVNSSVATNTANYIYKTVDGRHAPFDSLAELQGYAGTLTNNDYAFVVGSDAMGNTTYTRYKWSEATATWAEEYVLNNSSFTAEQWAAISSGITSGLVAKLGALPTAEALAEALAGKQDKLTFESSVVKESNNPVKSSGIWSAIWGTLSFLPSGISSLYDWCTARFEDKLDTLFALSYSELFMLRDAGKLIPGQQYRITDYVATTNGSMDSRSANHPFDIIVTADDENTLNEHARAILHEGDTYFANCDLAAWDVWYCLDNDTARFDWAVTMDGKGVIYRLIDEFQNDVPYDFKGIQFRRWAITDVTSSKLDAASLASLKSSFVKSQNDGLYYAHSSSNINMLNGNATLVVDGSDFAWCYTFGGATDLSRYGLTENVFSNKIVETYPAYEHKLNNIVFLGSNCYANTFGSYCNTNTFGLYCDSNTFGSHCSTNVFGSNCYRNTCGTRCYSNIFGKFCDSNMFGSDCYKNVFGSDCESNMFGAFCHSNTFGSRCSINMFGSRCSINMFGSYCSSNTFGRSCFNIRFGTASSVKSYCRYIRVGSGNHNLYINPTGTTSSSQYYQNVEIKEGVNNITDDKSIDDPNVGQAFLTTYKPANSQEISV